VETAPGFFHPNRHESVNDPSEPSGKDLGADSGNRRSRHATSSKAMKIPCFGVIMVGGWVGWMDR
jgi:hypothetical protein